MKTYDVKVWIMSIRAENKGDACLKADIILSNAGVRNFQVDEATTTEE